VRVLDFYLMFPFLVDQIRIAPHHRKFKKLAKLYAGLRPYGDLPENRMLFQRMAPIQGAALDTLVQRGLLSPDQYSRGIIEPTDTALPVALASKVSAINQEQSDLVEFLFALATEYDLLGTNGLKDRSGLMDYSYDAI